MTTEPEPTEQDDDVVVLTHFEVSAIRAEAREDAGLRSPEVAISRPDGQLGYSERLATARVVDPDLPELRHREGDQPLPTGDPDAPNIHEIVANDVLERMRLGVRRYGQPLKPRNGRDALRDAYEEALDLCAYLRQAIEERDSTVRP